MDHFVRISDAASLGMHAAGYLARYPPGEAVPSARIAEDLGVSASHLGKVLQRLSRVGLVSSRRGVHGGFALDREPGAVTLLDVYLAIDGPLPTGTCLLGHAECPGGPCVMGCVIHDVNERVRNHLVSTTLSDLAGFASFQRFGPGAPLSHA